MIPLCYIETVVVPVARPGQDDSSVSLAGIQTQERDATTMQSPYKHLHFESRSKVTELQPDIRLVVLSVASLFGHLEVLLFNGGTLCRWQVLCRTHETLQGPKQPITVTIR